MHWYVYFINIFLSVLKKVIDILHIQIFRTDL